MSRFINRYCKSETSFFQFLNYTAELKFRKYSGQVCEFIYIALNSLAFL